MEFAVSALEQFGEESHFDLDVRRHDSSAIRRAFHLLGCEAELVDGRPILRVTCPLAKPLKGARPLPVAES